MSLIYLSGISSDVLAPWFDPPPGESFPCNTVKHDVHKHTLVTSPYDDPRSAPSAMLVGSRFFAVRFAYQARRDRVIITLILALR